MQKMEYTSIKPKHCEGCPSYNSDPKMTFRYFQFKEKEITNVGDNDGIDCHHVIYLFRGKLLVTGEGIEDFIVTENRFFLALRRQKLTITALEETEVVFQDIIYLFYVCERISFDAANTKYLRETKNLCDFNSLEIRMPLLSCIKSIVFLIRDGILCDHMIRVKMQEIFLLYKHYYSQSELSYLFFPVFDKQMMFYHKVIAAAPRANSVKELAELSGYGLSNFKVHFKSLFRETPHNWMRKQKLAMLRIGLMDYHRPIKAIVEEFNFSDQSHLNSFCKRYLGGTARQVRERLLKL